MPKYRVEPDPYFDAENRIMKNKLGLVNPEELEVVEDELVLLRTAELLNDKDVELVSVAGLCHLHRRMFQDVYAWAGQFRVVDIIKGSSRFCHFLYIERELQRLFNELTNDELIKLSNNAFTVRLAYYISEFNVIHPFREGNGRVVRLWAQMLSRIYGRDIDWDRAGPGEIVKAMISSFKGDNNMLVEVLDKCLFILE